MTNAIPAVARAILFVCLLATGPTGAETAHAQLFGERTLGQPLRRRAGSPATSAMDSAGTVRGDERFLRGNRSRNDFVGSNRGSLEGFVGAGQAIGVGRVRSAVESLREPPDRSSQINRPLPKLPADAMYYPRLSIPATELASDAFVSAVTVQRDAKLEARLSKEAGAEVQVLHKEDRTVLRGIVASEAMAEKLRIVASFEPHIDTVEDQLVVAPQVEPLLTPPGQRDVRPVR